MSVSVSNITKHYGRQTALNSVSAEISDGMVVGLLGPNGAGKSTLMKIITGSVQADAGHVSICGLDIEEHPQEVRRLLGYLPEHNPLYPDMYVREYLEMAAGLYDVAGKRGRVDELIELTGLSPECHKKIGSLSKGYRQRVGIAQALIGDPRVVILDEPTTGLDPNQILDIRSLIRSLGKQRTVILSTHIMQEVEATCDNIIILDHGNVCLQGRMVEVTAMARKGQVVDVEFYAEVDVADLAAHLQAEVANVDERTYRIVASSSDDDVRLSLFRYATQHDTPILRLMPMQDDIESIFHRLTQQ